MTGKTTAILREKLLAVCERYPQKKSAVIPALRLAQEVYGWLPEEAIEEVADVLETTPANVQSVASFYDMFRLEKTGKHIIQVCTNVSCALNGAGEILDEFAEQLGIEPGHSTEDGQFTLTTVECLGSCATAPCVAVDHRYREEFSVAQVRPTVTELKASEHGWKEEESHV